MHIRAHGLRPMLCLACLTATLAAVGTTTGFAAAIPGTPDATHAASGYRQPPKAILDVMQAPSSPTPYVSPSRQHLLLVALEDYPSIERVATPFLRLAGVRIEPANHSKHDTPGGYGIAPAVRSFELVRLSDGHSKSIELPKGGHVGTPRWSADGKHFAFELTTPTAVELWIGDATRAEIRRIPGVRLNPMFGDEFEWMPDQQSLLVKLVPEGLGEAPKRPEIPQGPSIQQSIGGKGQSSTYEARDTLGSPHDEALFDHYGTAQLARIDVATGSITRLGQPDLYLEIAPAPDGHHMLISRLHKPYSYVTTFERFPREVEIWNIADPARIARHTVASLPLADRVPIHGVPLGPRQFSWRPTDPATLVWAEALDGGDWAVKVPHRDRILTQKAPFQEAPAQIFQTEQRYAGIAWGARPDLALLYEEDDNRHWWRSFIVNPNNPSQAPRLLWDLSSDEQYADPGSPVYQTLPNGARVLRQEGDSIFLAGNGASPAGERPFLDRLDLRTLKPQRLFRSEKTAYERFAAFTGPDAKHFLTWHQSPVDPPNGYVRTLGSAVKNPAAGEACFISQSTALTHLPDPAPEVRKIQKRLVNYKRADGMDLSFTLYTPPGYQEGTRVPTILYAYPQDFADPSKAGQVTGSQYTFTRLKNYRLLLLAGYALIDNASFPVVGDPKKAYDTYMEQLVADAKAAVDKAVELGVADPDRIGVTGHSHGALMTANLLAHSDLFRAGVATSGSYNKTLTPFGFQNERRSVWEAPDVYRQVSPFFFADKLKTPLLIVHGADDANPGTTPLQGTKLFEAVRGNGGTTRLVMLPHEPHWYTARESNEHLLFEMLNWFDTYVKNAPKR